MEVLEQDTEVLPAEDCQLVLIGGRNVLATHHDLAARRALEAAQLEGAGQLATLVRVALPQVRGGLIATGMLVFIFSWNELAFSFTLAGGAVKTGPVAILSFIAFQNVQVANLMAAANLLIAPIAILLIVAQKGLIRGLSFGAVKG